MAISLCRQRRSNLSSAAIFEGNTRNQTTVREWEHPCETARIAGFYDFPKGSRFRLNGANARNMTEKKGADTLGRFELREAMTLRRLLRPARMHPGLLAGCGAGFLCAW